MCTAPGRGGLPPPPRAGEPRLPGLAGARTLAGLPVLERPAGREVAGASNTELSNSTVCSACCRPSRPSGGGGGGTAAAPARGAGRLPLLIAALPGMARRPPGRARSGGQLKAGGLSAAHNACLTLSVRLGHAEPANEATGEVNEAARTAPPQRALCPRRLRCHLCRLHESCRTQHKQTAQCGLMRWGRREVGKLRRTQAAALSGALEGKNNMRGWVGWGEWVSVTVSGVVSEWEIQ